ncbi:MAG TPA: hypothetical protein VHM90_10125, partial [Phycisphaerae bacterium]|nr:hypothetical protein [Phycisphaerae bacterium]
PRTFFELGVQRSAAPAVVIAGCPTCETYLADQWAEDDTGGNPPVYRASNIVAAATPQAHSHFITADPATATQRLFTAIAPELRLDLALLRTDPLFGDALANAALVADRLTPGGAIAVSGHTPAAFAAVWNMLAARFQNNIQLQIRPPHGEARMGFILAVTPS